MSNITLTDGSPVTDDHREINPTTGQQKGYVVLSEEERAKGYVRPVRRSYVHLKCGAVTTMAQSIAETYARDPKFYSGTFCIGCRTHLPLDEFRWDGTNETAEKISNDLKVTIRCIPLNMPSEAGTDPFTGRPSKQRVIWAKSY